jgi:hypothetical protein
MFVNTTRKFTCDMCSNVLIRFKQKWDRCVQETFDKPSLDTTQKECDHPKTLEIVNIIEQSIVTALTTIHDSGAFIVCPLLALTAMYHKFISNLTTTDCACRC